MNKLNQDIRKLELQGDVHKRAKLLRRDSVNAMVQSLHSIQDAMLAEHARNQQALEETLLAESGGLEEEEDAPVPMEEEEEGALDDDRGMLFVTFILYSID